VEKVRRRLGYDQISERRACKVLGQPRSTQRYRPKRPDADRILIKEMRRLAEAHPRYGSERVYQELVNTGWRINFKRVHRIWKQEHMQVPQKQKRKRRIPGHSGNGCIRYRPKHKNHVWSYDFVTERTEDGRQLKLLVVIDEFTRECLAIEVGRLFKSRDVILTLQYLFAVRGAPQHIRSDNGPEFVAKQVQAWLKKASVNTLYIQKASPWENGYVESFNGKLRDELLNRELFLNLTEARYVIDEWRNEYNHQRRHSGIGWLTPASYAASLNQVDGMFPSTSPVDPALRATPFTAAQLGNPYRNSLTKGGT